MKLALEVFGSIMIVFSFLPLIKSTYWWIRVLDFPRPQIAFFLVVILGSYLYLYGATTLPEKIFLFLLGLALVNEVLHFYKFTILYPVEALRSNLKAPKNTFSIMISNVRMSNIHYNRFLKLVRENDPDILLINEPDHKWAQEISELDTVYAFSIKCPLENTYGMMFYSKFKLLNEEIRFLVEEGIPSFYAIVELPTGKMFDFYTVHPQPPHIDKNTDTREGELLQVARMAKASRYASIVAGDLNDVAWSHSTNLFRKISGLLDPRIGRGFYNTYNALIPFFRYSLDHIFYDPAFRLIRLKRLRGFGSDHFPILIRLSYEPQEADEHDPPKANSEEKAEAQELIENVKEN
ncbi:endonuclease [Adhaeribacter aerolatus]|uniref:Endonuclease n=1 Tax=Adhaeribacter aerolatus TaxID=670289 RepID=A0A512ATP4_9BACT|nr:endonuclease/exonuclease/phosphatase family protein [Adhaeribacter aerolatus]GEO03086.1 endonuclease [Adhaeribacter aerolatus]